MIKVNELSFYIEKQAILNNLNLNVSSGSYFALAGENGAGKSTLIKLMLDLLRTPKEQMILLNGQSSWQVNSHQFLSYLPEKFQVTKNVTGAQYLKFIAGIYQVDVAEKTISTLCQQLDFDEQKLSQIAAKYSKGMMQKLGLISNFMLKLPLMILDEPLSGLDPKARFCLKQLLQQKKSEGLTVFYSTHMLADAEELCDQFGILHQGQLKFVGTPSQCMSDYSASHLEQAYMSCIQSA